METDGSLSDAVSEGEPATESDNDHDATPQV